MSSFVKFFKTIRNNWKKSTVAAILLAYGINYGKTKYEILQMMRAYCEESKKFGEITIPVMTKPRHVTVIMNPACKNSKGPALFEKYAGPLLHLAGIRVSIIKTEREGQAKDIMGVMDNTDGVLIAGGDGTVLEAVTGLCRRDDSYKILLTHTGGGQNNVNSCYGYASFAFDTVSVLLGLDSYKDVAILKFPLGIIPIGKTNTVAKRLFWGDHRQEARLLAETAMAVIRGKTRPMDVMSIKGETGKPVYALASIEWGRYRDINTKISKYWYWGPLKSKMAYLFASIKKQAPPMDADLSYTLPCGGCSKCYEASSNHQQQSTSSGRWWHMFIPRKPNQSAQGGVPVKDYSGIINDECGIWNSTEITTVDFAVETSNANPHCESEEIPSLSIKIGPESVGRADFLLEGWRRTKEEIVNTESFKDVIRAREIKLEPKLPEDLESWYSIDSENHEVKAINVHLLPKKVHVFCK